MFLIVRVFLFLLALSTSAFSSIPDPFTEGISDLAFHQAARELEQQTSSAAIQTLKSLKKRAASEGLASPLWRVRLRSIQILGLEMRTELSKRSTSDVSALLNHVRNGKTEWDREFAVNALWPHLVGLVSGLEFGFAALDDVRAIVLSATESIAVLAQSQAQNDLQKASANALRLMGEHFQELLIRSRNAETSTSREIIFKIFLSHFGFFKMKDEFVSYLIERTKQLKREVHFDYADETLHLPEAESLFGLLRLMDAENDAVFCADHLRAERDTFNSN